MKIVITNFALQQLQDIYNYISIHASPNIANKEMDRIHLHISLIQSIPKIGREVEELKILNLNHRQLVVSNYKIIYRIKSQLFI